MVESDTRLRMCLSVFRVTVRVYRLITRCQVYMVQCGDVLWSCVVLEVRGDVSSCVALNQRVNV